MFLIDPGGAMQYFLTDPGGGAMQYFLTTPAEQCILNRPYENDSQNIS
jgi:hypothetical protein